MTLKIEAASDGETATLRLSGRLESAYLDEVRALLRRHRPRLVLDLGEVTLVDGAVVRFLIVCEAEGIELRHCAPYIREWMGREREHELSSIRTPAMAPCYAPPASMKERVTVTAISACAHLTAVTKVKQPPRHMCDECVKVGAQWVHLRTCQDCGVTLCCDNSPNRHATKHARASGHPVIASAEPGERWLYCYPDDAFAEY